MNRRISAGAELVIGCVAVLVGVAAASSPARAAATKIDVDLRQHPTGGKTQVEVAVGLYVTNLVAIDETRENFEVGGYLTGTWKDPRLALAAGQNPDNNDRQKTKRTFRVEELWTPPIEAANSISHKTNSYSLEADRDGVVTYLERFDAAFSNDFALRKFPFDTQVLRFEFQPFLSAASGILFAAQPLPSTGVSPEQHTELAAWTIKDLRYTAEKVAGNNLIPAAREALFQIVIERRSGFYIWKVFLPLLMLTMIPVVVFWIDVKEFDWILKVPMTMLLSMVAFEFTIARDLPRIGYVTFLDTVFLASFAFCFLCIFEITTVYLMQKAGLRAPAVKIHSAGKWAYPLAYFVVLLFLAICFLV
jgi:hypothetical protein